MYQARLGSSAFHATPVGATKSPCFKTIDLSEPQNFPDRDWAGTRRATARRCLVIITWQPERSTSSINSRQRALNSAAPITRVLNTKSEVGRVRGCLLRLVIFYDHYNCVLTTSKSLCLSDNRAIKHTSQDQACFPLPWSRFGNLSFYPGCDCPYTIVTKSY